MRGVFVCTLGLALWLCAVCNGTAHARHLDGEPEQPERAASPGAPSAEEKSRQSDLIVDEALPWNGYLRIGKLDWRGRRWARSPALSPIERTFMAVEAGREAAGLQAFMSAAGRSKSGELDPRFTVNAYRRWAGIGPASDLVASASATAGSHGDRPSYGYAGSGGFSVGPLSLFGHGTLVDTKLPTRSRKSWNARAQAGWRLARLLDTELAFEWSDPDHERRRDERTRLSVALESRFDQPVRARMCYSVLDGARNRRGSYGAELLVELHVSF